LADCRQIHTTKASKRSPDKYDIGGGQSGILTGFLGVFVSPSQYYCTMLRIYFSVFFWHNSTSGPRPSHSRGF